MWEYETVTIGTWFISESKLKSQMDEVLDKYSKNGWKLVNFQCAALGSVTILVFKRKRYR